MMLCCSFRAEAFLSNDSVTGIEVIEGMTVTGGLSVARTDRLLEKIVHDGDVIVIGERRSKRLSADESWTCMARNIADGVLAIVA